MRKLLIGVAATVLAAGYLTVSAPVAHLPVAHAEPMCPKQRTPGDNDPGHWIWVPCQVTGTQPPQATPVAPWPSAPPPVAPSEPSQSVPQPQNGCMIQGNGPLLQECPAYTCASITQEQARTECEALSPAEQAGFLNNMGWDAPDMLDPPPLGAPPQPPDDGPCSGQTGLTHRACQLFLSIAVWTSSKIGQPIENPPPGVNCCASLGIRG
jgi:hypothetical protein